MYDNWRVAMPLHHLAGHKVSNHDDLEINLLLSIVASSGTTGHLGLSWKSV